MKWSSARVSDRRFSSGPRLAAGERRAFVLIGVAAYLAVIGGASSASALQLAHSAPSNACTFKAKVTGIVDGDTLHVTDSGGDSLANTSSRVFHAASCRNAHCKNCTVWFATAQAAETAGYRPAGDCLR